MHDSIEGKRESLVAVCRQFHVGRLDVFGSATRERAFDPARSDVDLLVEFAPSAKPVLEVLLDLGEALQQALGRDVGLVERSTIERSQNYIRRRRIPGEAEPVYVA